MKKVLVIGYVYPEPNSSAAGTHILSIMRRFKKEHWEVSFSTPAQESEHAIDLASEGIDSQPILLNCDSFDQYIEENLEEHRINNFTGSMLKHHSLQSTKYMSQWIEVKSKLVDKSSS